jgi:23S rRNA pseudouridine1911/1915/1917 synthase
MTADTLIRLEVPLEAAGARLDQFLAEPLGSRARAQRLIDAQRVRVSGLLRPKRYALSPGELVEVDADEATVAPDSGEDSEVAPFGVAFEDQHLLVIDKPAGVVVHPARGHRQGTLAQALAGRAAGGDEEGRSGIVHRLDKDTSGLLVVARSDDVHRRLKAALAARDIVREYLLLVEGRPPARTGTIDAPIGRDRQAPMRMRTGGDAPREARTHFEVERLLPTTTLLRARLETGRTHQIRVHFEAIGHPVCGDPVYGHPGMFGLRRQFLHAARLAFEHPVTGEPIDITSPLPADLAAALALAERE